MTENNENNVLNENENTAAAEPEIKEETVAEAPAEEPVTEEEKPEENTDSRSDSVEGDYNAPVVNDADTSVFKPLSYSNDGAVSIDDELENLRKTYSEKLGASRKIDFIVIALMLVAFAGVVAVTLFNKSEEYAFITWIVLALAVAIIIFSFIIANIFNKKTAKVAKEYLDQYEQLLNGYALSDLNVDDAKICIDAKVDNQKVIEAHYFRVINDIQSRATVEAKRNGAEFGLSEVAVVIPTISFDNATKKPEDYVSLEGKTLKPEDMVSSEPEGTVELNAKDMTVLDLKLADEASGNADKKIKGKKQQEQKNTCTGIFGKYHYYDMRVNSAESVIISYMGDKKFTVLPDYLNGFKAVYVPGVRSNIVIYAINPKRASKFFDEKGVELINALEVNTVVQSAFISINSYGSKVSTTLCDDIMSLPIKESAKKGVFTAYKHAVDAAFAFVDYVDAKKESNENN